MKPAVTRKARRAVVIPMVAVLVMPILAMMAFSIDMGYAVEVRAELVNAADAAVLAGIQQVYIPYKQWRTATGSAKTTLFNDTITSVKATVTAVAGSNNVAGASL